MKKIFLYHLYAFLAGALALAFYFFWKISALQATGSFAIVPLLPIAIVYIIGFGILCLCSFVLSAGISYLVRRFRN